MVKPVYKKKTPSIVYWLGNNLYLNITSRCSNNCYFCIRNFREGVGGFYLKLHYEPSITQVISKLQEVINLKNWREIVFCGFGEPLERLDCILKICKWIRRYYGKPTVIRIDTNGQGFLIHPNRNMIKELKEAGVDKISISLNAHDKETYDQICRPAFNNAFKSVLDFVKKAEDVFSVEITAVALPEINLSKIEELAKKLNVQFRRREYIQVFW